MLDVLNTNGTSIISKDNIGHLNPIRYRGYYYDDESGYYYLQSRYYDPQTKRFINADDINVVNVTLDSITDKNLYTYCDNNPIMRYDDEGEFWNTLVNTVAGAVSGAISASLNGENILEGALQGAASGFVEGLTTDILLVCCTNPVTIVVTVAVVSGVTSGFINYASQIYSGKTIDEVDWKSVAFDASFTAISSAMSFVDIDLNKNSVDLKIPDKNDVVNFYDKTFDEFIEESEKAIGESIKNNCYSSLTRNYICLY